MLMSCLSAGALPYDVRNCLGERKDGLGIAKIFIDAAIDLMGSREQGAEFGGWCIDGTKANRSAKNVLKEICPQWINTTCVAHGCALAIKDFCKYSQTHGCKWIQEVNDQANTIANSVQDSEITYLNPVPSRVTGYVTL
jgi:hypothetical protein